MLSAVGPPAPVRRRGRRHDLRRRRRRRRAATARRRARRRQSDPRGDPRRRRRATTASPPGKESIVAPSPEGQVAAIEAALARRRRLARDDRLRRGARHRDAPGRSRPRSRRSPRCTAATPTRTGFCSLGSVKANIGHTRCGAGVASLIKACLALTHRTIPPLANFAAPNPRIDFARARSSSTRDARPWAAADAPRRAAVSSFGFGGSQRARRARGGARGPATRATRAPPPARRVRARRRGARRAASTTLDAHLEAHPALAAADVAHTLDDGPARVRAPRRVRRRRRRVAQRLRRAARRARRAPDGAGERRVPVPRPGIAALRRRPRALRDASRCSATRSTRAPRGSRPRSSVDLRALLGYGDGRAPADDAARAAAHRERAAGALRRRLRDRAPLRCRGASRRRRCSATRSARSSAACLAGVFTLDDALALVAARARLMQQCEPGAMAAVFAARGAASRRGCPRRSRSRRSTRRRSPSSPGRDERRRGVLRRRSSARAWRRSASRRRTRSIRA